MAGKSYTPLRAFLDDQLSEHKTQPEIAKLLGCGPASLRRWLAGEKMARKMVRKIAKKLSLEPQEIVSDWPTDPPTVPHKTQTQTKATLSIGKLFSLDRFQRDVLENFNGIQLGPTIWAFPVDSDHMGSDIPKGSYAICRDGIQPSDGQPVILLPKEGPHLCKNYEYNDKTKYILLHRLDKTGKTDQFHITDVFRVLIVIGHTLPNAEQHLLPSPASV